MLNNHHIDIIFQIYLVFFAALLLITAAQTAYSESNGEQTQGQKQDKQQEQPQAQPQEQQSADKRITALTNLMKALADNEVTAEEAIGTARIVNSHNKPPLS